MNENKFDESTVTEKCNKAIQDLLDASNFHTREDAGLTLGRLLLQATVCLDKIMGSHFAIASLMAVGELMASGEPQKYANVEMIERSKLN